MFQGFPFARAEYAGVKFGSSLNRALESSGGGRDTETPRHRDQRGSIQPGAVGRFLILLSILIVILCRRPVLANLRGGVGAMGSCLKPYPNVIVGVTLALQGN